MAKKGITVSLAAAMLVLVSQSPHAQTAESYVWQSVAIRGADLFPGLCSARPKERSLCAHGYGGSIPMGRNQIRGGYRSWIG